MHILGLGCAMMQALPAFITLCAVTRGENHQATYAEINSTDSAAVVNTMHLEKKQNSEKIAGQMS